MVLEEAQRPPFDPLAPLLPEEVCWILDRSISCEVSERRPCIALPLISTTDGMAHREYPFPNSVHVSLRTRGGGNAFRLPIEFRR
jgi:hypothetical protein